MADDDTRYRVGRRTPPANRDTLRDVVPPIDLAAPTEDLTQEAEAARFPAGSKQGVARVTPPAVVQAHAHAVSDDDELVLEIAEPGLLIEKRTFGGHQLLVQHRGDEVTVILPGAVRLVGTRDEALELVRALLVRPSDRRK